MTWLKEQDACLLDPEALSSLLEYHQRNEWEALKLYGHHKNVMLVLITAVFAGSAALLTTSTQAFLWLALFVPAAISTTCFFARKSLDRYYQRFLEAIVSTVKTEFMLGRYCHGWPKQVPKGFCEQVENGKYPFKEDSTIDVDRRWHSRLDTRYASSNGWIAHHMSEGHNGVVGRFLGMLFLFSLFVPVAAFLRVAGLQPTLCPRQFWHAFCGNWLFAALVVLSLLLSVWLHAHQCCSITQGRLSDQEVRANGPPNQ